MAVAASHGSQKTLAAVDMDLGLYWDFKKLTQLNIGYAGAIFCHKCACEVGARDFAGYRGWCYVEGGSDLRLYVESQCDDSTDALIDEIAELIGLSGDVYEKETGQKGQFVRIDTDDIDRRMWKEVFQDIPTGCIEV